MSKAKEVPVKITKQEIQKHKVVRNYSSGKISDIINFPNKLKKDSFTATSNPEILKAPIIAWRIIFRILNDISRDQFRKENEKQLKTFQLLKEEFQTTQNAVCQFTIPAKDVDPSLTYRKIRKAMEFLENYDKRWIPSKNGKGAKKERLEGLIIAPTLSSKENKGNITFLMSGHRLTTFLELGYYNPILTRLVNKLNSKEMTLFLALVNLQHGARIKHTTFNEIYNLNYKNAIDIGKYFLKPLKNKLDAFSTKTFNFKTKNGVISIKTTDNDVSKFNIDHKTKHNLIVRQRIYYIQKKHDLSPLNAKTIKEYISLSKDILNLFNSAYKDFVSHCRKNKIKSGSIKGRKFLNQLQKHVETAYKSSKWYNKIPKGYPVFN